MISGNGGCLVWLCCMRVGGWVDRMVVPFSWEFLRTSSGTTTVYYITSFSQSHPPCFSQYDYTHLWHCFQFFISRDLSNISLMLCSHLIEEPIACGFRCEASRADCHITGGCPGQSQAQLYRLRVLIDSLCEHLKSIVDPLYPF